MKLAKRMLALAVAVMLVMAVLVVPASATLPPPFYSHVCGFVELYNGSTANGYVRAIQAFLYHYPYTQTTIINGGGIDGGYGNATESAVKIYQQKKWPNTPSEWDGRVGTKTWTKVAGDLIKKNVGSETYLNYGNGRVMNVVINGSSYSYYNCNTSGTRDRFIVTRQYSPGTGL